jgi:ferredoxin, 2Fe-2S
MKEPQMPTITFVNRDGTREEVAATNGDSAMQAATTQGVHGIVAGCGGNAKCATCHVYVDESWLGRLPRMSSDEDALLDGTAADRRSNSRPSCQIRIDPELDGLVLRLPERQVSSHCKQRRIQTEREETTWRAGSYCRSYTYCQDRTLRINPGGTHELHYQ